MTMKREIRLLWTGGWDSTFRLLQLSQVEAVVVRPMYVRDRARGSMANELAAMKDILPRVRALARARVLDVDLYDAGAIRAGFPDEEVSAACARLAEEFRLVYQYELFALLCRGLDVRAECCVEDSPRSHAKAVIDAQCELVPLEDAPLAGAVRYRAVPKGTCGDGALVFARLDLPMLAVSKVEAQRVSEQMGWMPIMHRTWFCFGPMRGRPCGLCGPCQDAMNEGMRWRLPLSARLRYHTRFLRGRKG